MVSGYVGHARPTVRDDAEDDLSRSLERVIRISTAVIVLSGLALPFSMKRIGRTPKPLDLNEVVSGLSSILARVAGADTELVIDTRARHATVLADAGELEQVILNLALNARDAMPRGGRLSIETERVPDPTRSRSRARRRPTSRSSSRIRASAWTRPRRIASSSRSSRPKVPRGERGSASRASNASWTKSGGRIRVETAPGSGARFEVILPCLPTGDAVTRAVETRPA